MSMKIVPTGEVDWPPPYKDATEKYSAQVRLSHDNRSLVGYVAGQPFPLIDTNNPLVATKIMWNNVFRPLLTDDYDLRFYDCESVYGGVNKPNNVINYYQIGHYAGYDLVGRVEVEPMPIDPDFKKTNRLWLLGSFRCFRPRPIAAKVSSVFGTSNPIAPKVCAEGLVESLVSIAPVILFSAAVPLQGGVNHVNEQWPDYWAQIFLGHNYRQVDVLRKRIWKLATIKYFYRQNIFLYVREDRIAENLEFQEAVGDSNDLMLVHHSILNAQLGLRSILKNLAKSAWKFAGRGLQKLRG